MKDLPEQELVRAARGGDADAFEALVRRYEKPVYALTLRMCGNPADAQEAAQEAFLSAWQSLPFFRGEASFSTWLYRLASNASIDLLRRAGAKEIHMRVSAPPFVSECYYGTDIDDKNKLIANHHTVEEIAQIIGVDSLGYLSIQDVVKLADNTESGFCTACFGGGYPTSTPKDGGKDRFECKISEKEK